jgi:hypothetical protein
MPPCLRHWHDMEKPYDPAKSEVIAWLMEHPQAGQVLFNAVKASGAITYSRRSQTWSGCRWDAPERSTR